ncbi:MAG: hypothetical protein WCA77_02610 [Thermoplasmata archaeon]
MSGLFGSEVRARTLGVLAGAERPITAYRVAQATGDQGTQVYTALRKAKEWGIVEENREKGGASVWSLSDPNLRSFLNQRIRISVLAEFMDSSRRKTRPGALLNIDLSAYPSKPIPQDSELYRPPEKDELLERRGLRSRRQTLEAWKKARKAK